MRHLEPFRYKSDRLYLAFFKPFEVLTQFTSEGSDKQTLSTFGFPPEVYPIGRLDYDSEGLLLLSDDGSFNNYLLHPQRKHSRTYLAQVENTPEAAALDALRKGVVIQGRKTLPAEAQLIDGEPLLPPRPIPIRFRQNIPTAWIRLTLHEGKNRQVRRMTAAVGHPTLRLVREAIGNLRFADLGLVPGKWVKLTGSQLAAALEQ